MIYAKIVDTEEVVTGLSAEANDSYETAKQELENRGYTVLWEEIDCLNDMTIWVW